MALHAPPQRMDDTFALITGASSGIGLATARELARRGAAVLMVCREPGRAAAARQEVAKVATGKEPAVLLADLSSQAQIRALAREIQAGYSHLDVLINNAGSVFSRRELTVDGIEKTFAVNHLAPFLLTNLLLSLVQAVPGGRIVTVSSESHSRRLDFDNLQGEKHYQFLRAYGASKTENILFTNELARRLKTTHVTANAVSPGPAKTRFGDNLTGASALFPKIMKTMPFFASPDKAAHTSIYAACDPELDGISGRFYLHGKEKGSKPITHDRDVAARLWTISEELTAIRYGSSEPSTSR